jgi:hypothetical protein
MNHKVVSAQEAKYGFTDMKNDEGTWTHHDETDRVTISRKVDDTGSGRIVVYKTEKREVGKLETVKSITMDFDEKSGKLLSASFYKKAPAEGKDEHLGIQSGVDFRDEERWLREFRKAESEKGKATYQGLGMKKDPGGWFAKDPENREIKIEKGRDYTIIDFATKSVEGWTDKTMRFDKEGNLTHFKFSSREIGVLVDLDIHEEEQRLGKFRAHPAVSATELG